MSKAIEKYIEELRARANEIEQWILEHDYSDDPKEWRSKINEYHNVLFDLRLKRSQLYNEDHEAAYYETTCLPRIVNRSTNVIR